MFHLQGLHFERWLVARGSNEHEAENGSQIDPLTTRGRSMTGDRRGAGQEANGINDHRVLSAGR